MNKVPSRLQPTQSSQGSARSAASLLVLMIISLSFGCGDEAQDQAIIMPPKAASTPYDESLLRWQTYPETANQDGPWTLEERADFYGVPGIAIFAWNGRTTLDRAFGIASPDKTEMLTSTVVAAGPRLSTSVSSLVVMAQLSASSRNLNKPLRQELAATRLREKLHNVTLAQLLSHSSGIGPAQIPEDANSLEDIISKARYLSAPGITASFSETGYAVVQRLFEEVTVRPWSTLANQRLFRPLQMSQTQYGAPPSGLVPAVNYNSLERPTTTPHPIASAANGLFTSARDMATLLQAVQQTFRRERRNGPFTARQLLFAVEPELGSWTMGWQSWTGLQHATRAASRGNGRVIIAMGPGNQHIAVLFRDRPAGAVITTNGARGGELAQEVLLGLAQQFGWNEFKAAPVYPSPPGEGIVEALVGKWAYISQSIEIAWQDETLVLSGFSEKPTPMLSVGSNQWLLRDAPQRISLNINRADQIRIDGSLALRSERPSNAPIVIHH